MNQRTYTDADGRDFGFNRGHRVYLDGGANRGTPVPRTPPPSLASNGPILDARYRDLAIAVRKAGFAAEEVGADTLVCMFPDDSHLFQVSLQSDHWLVARWGGRFYRGRDVTRLSEFCLLVLRTPLGVKADSQSWNELPLPKTIQEEFGLKEYEFSEEAWWRAIRPGFDGLDMDRQMLAERFGFRPYSVREEGIGPVLHAARAAMDEAWDRSVPVQLDRVFVNDDFVFLPTPYISCGGPARFLFERRSGRGHTVGGGGGRVLTVGGRVEGPHVEIWAYYPGIGFADESRLGTVTITNIHNREGAEVLLRPDPHRCPAIGELKKQLAAPLCIVHGVDLWLLVRLLYIAEKKKVFDFDITPSIACPDSQ